MLFAAHDNTETVMGMPTNREAQEAQYHGIVALFDDCDALADSIEATDAAGGDAEAQLILLAPLMSDVSAEADVLTEEYITLAEIYRAEPQGNPAKVKHAKAKIEASLRKIYLALDQYRLRVRQSAKSAAHTADALVAKLQEHVEQVVLTFVSILNIALSRIMQNAQAEAFKARHKEAMLAFQQYNQGLAAQH